MQLFSILILTTLGTRSRAGCCPGSQFCLVKCPIVGLPSSKWGSAESLRFLGMAQRVPRNRKLLDPTASIGSLQSRTLKSRLVVNYGRNQALSGPNTYSYPRHRRQHYCANCRDTMVNRYHWSSNDDQSKDKNCSPIEPYFAWTSSELGNHQKNPFSLPQTFVTSVEPDETNSFPHPLITTSLLLIPYRNIPLPEWRLIIPK